MLRCSPVVIFRHGSKFFLFVLVELNYLPCLYIDLLCNIRYLRYGKE